MIGDEQAQARATMPRDAHGAIVNLFFVPPKDRNALEDQWRAWARAMPRHLHPPWFADWSTYKRTGIVPTYVGGYVATARERSDREGAA